MSDRRLRALVLEDERPARSYLVELLHDTEQVSVVAAVATAAQAHAALREEPSLGIELAFVDVRLAGSPDEEAGLTWMREVSRGSAPPRFVLTTASSEHALEAYRLGAIDYPLKPFTAELVAETIARASAWRPPRPASGPERARVVARDGRHLVFLELDEVLAFEAEARLTFVHSTRGRFDVDLLLAALESALAGQALLRTHRNWLVHLPAVSGLERDAGETTLRLGREGVLSVPVARERAGEIRELLVERAVGLRRSG
jgi:DNA-binding LytR/AlgR family response regulator